MNLQYEHQTNRRGRFQPKPPLPEPVSGAVKHSLHAVNARGAPRAVKERELVGILLAAPALVERHTETLAKLHLEDPQLDRLKTELLNLAASGSSLEKATVEGHLVRQGMGVLVERLTSQKIVRTAPLGAGPDGQNALFAQAIAQLAEPDGELKARRNEALQRYVDGGSAEDWNEMERLAAAQRAAEQKM